MVRKRWQWRKLFDIAFLWQPTTGFLQVMPDQFDQFDCQLGTYIYCDIRDEHSIKALRFDGLMLGILFFYDLSKLATNHNM